MILQELDIDTRYYISKYKQFYFVIWVLKFKNIFKTSYEEAIIKFFNLLKNRSNFKKMIKKYNSFICEYELDIDNIFNNIKLNHNYRPIKRKIKCFSINKIKKRINEERKQKFFEKHGYTSVFCLKSVKEKAKKTILEKYGAENVFSNDEIKEKSKLTKLERYGDKYFNNRDKAKNTSVQNYGVENRSQLGDYKDIFKNFDWSERNKKTKETSLYKYNTNNPTQRHINNFENFNIDYVLKNFIKDDKFLKDDFMSYFNVSYKTVLNFKHEHNIKNINKHNLNKMENEFIKKMNIYLNRKLQQQVKISNYRVDAFDDKTNTIYEFLGDYWHGNINVYSPFDINKTKKQLMIDLYNETFDKLNCLKKLGYNIKYIWENDYRKFGLNGLKEI